MFACIVRVGVCLSLFVAVHCTSTSMFKFICGRALYEYVRVCLSLFVAVHCTSTSMFKFICGRALYEYEYV